MGGPEAAGTDINETAAVVVMCAGASADEQKAIEKALEPLAKSYIAEARKAGDTPKYIFLLAKSSGGATEQLETLTKKDAGDAIAAAGDRPVTLLLDIPDNGGFYLSGAHEITSESVAAPAARARLIHAGECVPFFWHVLENQSATQ